jgi:DNA polymerase III epsilon subunit-like protein
VKRKLLVIDTETGGLNPECHAILSLAAVVYHDAPEEHIHLVIKDPEGLLSSSALAVNGFTEERVNAEGVTPWEAVQRLKALLQKNDMRGRVTLVGHNLPFDVGFLRRLYRLAGEDFDAQFSHGGLDTKVAALLLEQAGRISMETASLIHAAPAVGVKVTQAHDALSDALATAKALKRMLDLIKHTDWTVTK